METNKPDASGEAGAADLSQTSVNQSTEIHTDEAKVSPPQQSPCEVPNDDLREKL